MWWAGISAASAQVNLGLVGIRSAWGAYLQAQPDGTLHARTTTAQAEATWFLIQVNGSQKIYAIYNWQNGQFMSKQGHCAAAVATVLGPTEQWRLVSGKRYGMVNAVMFQSVADQTVLEATRPGKDTACAGEVAVQDPRGRGDVKRLLRNSSWGGWWVLEPANPPTAGQDIWNKAGGRIGDIPNETTPADVATLLADLS